MDLLRLFDIGAAELARDVAESAEVRSADVSAAEWKLLTQKALWTPSQIRRVPQALADVVNASLTVAGIPAMELPGQYVAAVICRVVAVPNRLVAARQAPASFDGHAASGVEGAPAIVPVSRKQMIALVMVYSSNQVIDCSGNTLPDMVREEVQLAVSKALKPVEPKAQ